MPDYADNFGVGRRDDALGRRGAAMPNAERDREHAKDNQEEGPQDPHVRRGKVANGCIRKSK